MAGSIVTTWATQYERNSGLVSLGNPLSRPAGGGTPSLDFLSTYHPPPDKENWIMAESLSSQNLCWNTLSATRVPHRHLIPPKTLPPIVAFFEGCPDPAGGQNPIVSRWMAEGDVEVWGGV